MEIWQHIELLRKQKKKGFFSKEKERNSDEKIQVLTIIANEGTPSDIYSIIEFLKDGNQEIRQAVCDTVIQLFKKIDSKKGYYNTLRHCRISQNDIDFYKTNFPTEQYVELLAISSLNENGYVREKAVSMLANVESPRAIQFLIYRLADWVSQVRQVAARGIENYKSIVYIDSLVENLPIFEWLQKVERVNLSGIYNDMVEFVVVSNRDNVIENFKTYSNRLKLFLAKHISLFPVDSLKELNLFLTDKHFLVRIQALNYFSELSKDNIDQLLKDKSSKVRLQTLYCLKEKEKPDSNLKNFLADDSAAIRHFVRFELRESGLNIAEIYNENLNQNDQVIGSLTGLAELEAKQYKNCVKTYLSDDKLKVRKAAFLALCKLDKESAYEFALINLDCSFEGLRNLNIDYLSHIPREEVLFRAREIYRTGGYELKKSMLKLFNRIGGIVAIPDIMYGTIDENEKIRQVAFDYLQIWKGKAFKMSSLVKQDEIAKAQQVFKLIYPIHSEKRYFESNPLEGLDFYLN